METSEKTDMIDAALAAAQAEILPAIKDSLNPHFKSSYADLASIKEVTRAPLAKHGLNVTQNPLTDMDRKAIGCYVRIGHKSGQFIKFDALWVQPARGLAPQDVGSALTYLRRYTYSAALALVADDDDGNAAEGRSKNDLTQSKLSERAEKALGRFAALGWSQRDLEAAIGVPLAEWTDSQFAVAQQMFAYQKNQGAQKQNARDQFKTGAQA